jgi:hypothetical protein
MSIMTTIMVWERKKERKEKIIRMKLEEDQAMVGVYCFNVLL